MAAPKLIFIVPAGMLLIALLPMPYGYYQLLRLAVFACSAVVAIGAWKWGKEAIAICFGLFALLYNPLFRVTLEREVWQVANIATAAVFVLALWLISRDPRYKGTLPSSNG